MGTGEILEQLLRKSIASDTNLIGVCERDIAAARVMLDSLPAELSLPLGTSAVVTRGYGDRARLTITYPATSKGFGFPLVCLRDEFGIEENTPVEVGYGRAHVLLVGDDFEVAFARMVGCRTVKVRAVVERTVCGDIPEDWDVVEG